MSPCLTAAELIDLVDGTLSAVRRAHLAECDACRTTADEVAGALRLALEADVPEPPSQFWSGVNARVRSALDVPAPAWRRWLSWPTLVPLAGAAVVVAAMLTRGASPESNPGALASSSVDAAAVEVSALAATTNDDEALALVADLVATTPDGAWDVVGMTVLPELDVAADALTADERQALADLLRAAVERPAS